MFVMQGVAMPPAVFGQELAQVQGLAFTSPDERER